MNLLYDKKMECPNCKMNFTSKKVFTSKLQLIKTDTDLKKSYKKINPYIYEINICPFCGYAFGETANIRLPEYRVTSLIDYFLNIKHFAHFTKERTVDDAIRSFKLALYIAERISQPCYVKAGLSIKIAWLYRATENTYMERKYIEMAFIHYEKSYSDEDFERAGYKNHFMLYMLCDLSRRLDNYERAKRWYSELFSAKDVPKVMMNTARDCWSDYKNSLKSRV